ncbi:MAG: hypothetical protein RL021_1326 [Bacteroidota bacterium]|jgi:hypothetical protein
MLIRKLVYLLFAFSFFVKEVVVANETAPGIKWDAPASFRRLQPLHTFPFAGYPDTSGSHLFFGGFQLLKDPSKGWLLIGEGNGQVWSLNKEDRWVRQDSTECIGYNSGALVLPGPLKYGGYGIWRSFGLLLFYSWEAHEWHTIELSEEHPRNTGTPVFYDALDSSIYQAGSYSRNDGMKKVFQVTDSVYRLDLRTGDWVTLGRLNPTIPHDYKIAAGEGLLYQTPTGVLFIGGNSRNPLHIDFKEKRCRILSDKVSDRLWTLSESRYSKDKKVLTTDWGVYSINHNYEAVDSAAWASLLDQVVQDFPLIEEPSSSYSAFFLELMAGTTVIAGLFLVVRRWRRKTMQRKSVIAEDTTESGTLPFQSVYVQENDFTLYRNGDTFNINGRPLTDMYEQELRLLGILYDQRKAAVSLSTQEFNEILGIEDRSLDNQKKIRSEIIRSINRHFNANGFAGEAVQRSRQEADRRAVSYVLAPEILIG